MNCLERVPERQRDEDNRELRIDAGNRKDSSERIEGNNNNARQGNKVVKNQDTNSSAAIASSPSLSSASMSQDSPSSESSSREIQTLADRQQKIKGTIDNSIDEEDENIIITPSNSKKRRQVIYETLSDDSDIEQPNNVKTANDSHRNQSPNVRTMESSSVEMPQDQQNLHAINDQFQQQQDKVVDINSDQQIQSEDSDFSSNSSSNSRDNLERKSNQDIKNQNVSPKLLGNNESNTPNKSTYVGRFEESMRQLEARYQASHEIKQTFQKASELLAMKSTFPKQSSSSSAALSPCESSRRRGITLDSYVSQDAQTPKQQRDISLLEKPSLTDVDVQEYVLRVMKKKQKNPKEKCVLQRILSSLGLFSEKSRQHLLFNSVTTDILFENLTLEHFQKHEVIFNLGEFGNKYYIIVKGGAHLLLPSMGSKDVNLQSELSTDKDESLAVKFMHRMQNLEDLKNINITESNKQQQQQPEGNSISLRNKHQKLKSPREIPVIPSSVVVKDLRQQPKKVYLQGCRYFKRVKDHLRQSSTQLSTEKDFVLLFGGIDNARQSLINSYYLDDSKQFVECFFPSMQLYKTFLPSEAFGEIALLTKQRRTATMLCSAETFCLSLSKQGFDQIIGVYQKALIQQQVNFLMQFPFLEKIPKSKILSILHDMKPLECQKNQIIYKEGDLCEYFYFIKEGDFEISKVETEAAIQGREIEQLNPDKSSFQETSRSSVFENQRRDSNTAHFFVSLNRSKQLKIEKKMKKKIPLIILSANRFFGQNEILREMSFRQTAATCISFDGKLFTIPKNILLHHLETWNGLDDLKKLDHVINAWSYKRFNSIIKLKQKDSSENASSNNSTINTLRGSLSSGSRNSTTTTTAGVSKHFLRKNYLKKNTYNEYSVKATSMNSSNKQNCYDSVNDKLLLNKSAGQFHKSVCLQSSPLSSVAFDRCKPTNRENNFIKNQELEEFTKTSCMSSNPMLILDTNEKEDKIGSLNNNGNLEPAYANNDGLSNEDDTSISRFSSSCASPKNFSRFRSYHPLQPSLQIDLNNQGQHNHSIVDQLGQHNCEQISSKKDQKLFDSPNGGFQELLQSNITRNHRNSDGLQFQEDSIYYPEQEDPLGHETSAQKNGNSLDYQNSKGNTKRVYVNPFFFAGKANNKGCPSIQRTKQDRELNSLNPCSIPNQNQLGYGYLNTSNSSICNSNINMISTRLYSPQNQLQYHQQQPYYLPQINYGKQRINNTKHQCEDADKIQHELDINMPTETDILNEFRQSSPFMKLQEVKETLSLKKHYLHILNANSTEQPDDYLAAFFNIKSSKTMLLKVKAQSSLQNNSVLNSHRPSQLLNISNLHRKAQKLYTHKGKKKKIVEGKQQEQEEVRFQTCKEDKCQNDNQVMQNYSRVRQNQRCTSQEGDHERHSDEGRIQKINNTKNLSLKITDKIKLSLGNKRESVDVAVKLKSTETNAQRKNEQSSSQMLNSDNIENNTLRKDYLEEQGETSMRKSSNWKEKKHSKKRQSNGAQTEEEEILLLDNGERLKGQSSLALILGKYENVEILQQSDGKQKHHKSGILGYKQNIIQRIQLKEQQYYLAKNKPSSILNSPKQHINGFNSTNLSKQSLECLSAGPTGSIHNNIYTSIMQKILSKTQTQDKTNTNTTTTTTTTRRTTEQEQYHQ